MGAASLGDVVTLGLLAWISDVLYNDYTVEGYKAHIIIGGYFLMLPIFLALAYNNEHVSDVLRVGWTPVLMAMLIASGGGFVLEMAVEHFKGVTLFAPVMNGSGGDLVGIQASRMTTYLHKVPFLIVIIIINIIMTTYLHKVPFSIVIIIINIIMTTYLHKVH